MELTDFWFIIIAVLWTGYFFLEGFDFGVGMLLHPLSKDEIDRRVMINTIGPVWDGNEVWLPTFAAFPNWYASLFSGFYLALFLILIALIVRGVAFEYRGKVSTKRWKSTWDLMIAIGSWVPAILWGVAFANIVHGVPIDADGNFTGNLFTLITPYSLLGGVTIAALCAFHGANFLALKTTGDIQGRSQSAATMLGAVAVVLGGSFLLWTQLDTGEGWTWIPLLLAAVGLVASIVAGRAGRDGWAFVGTGAAIAFAIVMLFGSLYPDVLPSTIDPAYSLTVDNASSADYTLKVMTVVALVMTPVVLLYQAWTYWIFRKRVGRHHIPTSAAH